MTNETFTEILRNIQLPIGTCLLDGTTYRIEKNDFKELKENGCGEIENFDKFLVLSDGDFHVVGGVLFYGNVDMQIITLEEYRQRHFMSMIHKNGVLKMECYENQRVSLTEHEIRSMDDFLLRIHMLNYLEVTIKNLRDIYKWMNFYQIPEMKEYDEETFIHTFSLRGNLAV